MSQKSPTLSVTAFSALFEFAPDGIVIVNHEGRIVFVNSQAEKLLGYERTELINQPSEFLVPMRFRERHRKYRASLIRDPKSQAAGTGMELCGLHRDGSEFQTKIFFTPVQTDDGLLVYAVIRGTQSKLETLRASEVRFRRLFETAKDAILLLDASTGHVRDVNRFLIEMLGYSQEEFLGKKLWESDPFKNNEALQTIFQELQRKPYIRYEDLPLQTKNGNSINAELVGNVYRVNRERVIQCVIRDITERKRAETALRQSEERYRAMFEQDLAGDYISTADGKFLACNSSFARMFGFITIEEAKDASLKSLYPTPMAYEVFLRSIKEKRKLVGFEEDLRRRDGTTLHVVTRVIGVFDQREELVEIHAYLIDESERIKTELQIRQVQKMDAMGRLAAGVAHDFNNLLGIIIGQSEILSDQANCDNRTRDGLAEIGKAADRGAALTRQLLAFTRQQVLEPRVLDLNGIVTETDKMLGRLIGENIEVVMNLHADLGRVKADPNQIVQVILNLAVNSRDAMPGGGKLTVETSNMDVDGAVNPNSLPGRTGQYVALRVTDTGTGMDAETMAHIFEPFFSTKGIGKGTGLGLATVHGIVTQSDGQISVQSQPGLGTTFEILLPRVKEEISAPSALGTRAARGSETILLVEDSTDLRDIVRQFLEIDGYTILGAGDATEALQSANQHAGPIHLILTDLVLPGVSGLILAEQVMRIRPEANVLFMSGYMDDTLLYKQVSQAALNFIQKPFSRSNLVSKIRQVLDDSQTRTTNSNKLLSA